MTTNAVPPPTAWHPKNYFGEAAAMAAFMVVLVGLLIAVFHPGWPLARWLPGLRARLFVVGLFLGLGIYALSRTAWGKLSGPQLDPVFSLALWAQGKMPWRDFVGFASAQFVGAIVGTGLSRLAFGKTVETFRYGALGSDPKLSFAVVFAAEACATFVFVGVLLACVCLPKLHRYTMQSFIVLLPVIVCVDGPVSGSGMNPARWLGSALLANHWHNAAVYTAAPLVGTLLAVGLVRRLTRGQKVLAQPTDDLSAWSEAA